MNTKINFRKPDFTSENQISDYNEKIIKMKALSRQAEEWAIKAHADTNHFYDVYIPYEFHLRMAVQVAKDFFFLFTELEFWTLICCLWLHDTIEDARKTYNDILSNFGYEVAEVVRAVTNYGRGRTRNERMPDWVYEEIASNFMATAAKACDRGANGQYSHQFGSGMFKKYGKEDEHFRKMLLVESNKRLTPMFDFLTKLFKSEKISFDK